MISPGFFSFFNAQRGLVAAQMALNTVNHNISNANTPGYSKQRVDMAAYTAYTVPTPVGTNVQPGQLGQGVDVTGVTRTRDQFLDAQYRLENSILGMNTNARDILQQIEGILVEPSNGGINQSIQNLFDAAQEMSLHPESLAVRADFLQQAVDVVTVFQQQATQLSNLRQDLVGDPNVPGSFGISHLAINVADVNTKLENITRINQQIVTLVSSGATPNDLYDQRDKLLDDLSKLVDSTVTQQANGQINLSIGGELMVRGASQINWLEVVQNPGGAGLPNPADVPSLIQTANPAVTTAVLNDGLGTEISRGQIKAILDMGGNNPNYTTVYGTLTNLDTMMTELATQINTLQTTGRDLNGVVNGATPVFSNSGANPLNIMNWSVNPTLLQNPNQVAAAPSGAFLGPGDGRNALSMAQLRNGTFATLGNTSFVDYFNGIISNLGIDTRSFEDRTTSQQSLVGNLDLRRESISGVNIDEEMIDMLRYQRAFEASSKLIGVFDEVIQTIINMT